MPEPKDNAENAARTTVSVQPHYGSAVRGVQRWPRPDLEAQFDSALAGGNGAKLFGLRRIGKSTEAVACAARLQALGWTTVALDCQDMATEAQLLMKLFAELPSRGWAAGLLKAVTGDSLIAAGVRDALTAMDDSKLGDVNAYFGSIANAIERALRDRRGTAEAGAGLLLCIDELPWLCRRILESDPHRGRQRVDQLFAALRRWRDAGMVMLLIGSIGLMGLGRAHGLDMDHLNDLTTLSVPPLAEPDAARAFVAALAAHAPTPGWTDAHTEAVLDESAAWYPAMLQKAFQVLTPGGRAVSLARIPDLFAEQVRPDLDLTFFQQFDRRLKRYADAADAWSAQVRDICEAVLGAAAPVTRAGIRTAIGAYPPQDPTPPQGTTTSDAAHLDEADLGDALEALREDGFIDVRIERDGTQHWRPASPLVAAWRLRRRGGG
jgi:hypothetical protein